MTQAEIESVLLQMATLTVDLVLELQPLLVKPPASRGQFGGVVPEPHKSDLLSKANALLSTIRTIQGTAESAL